MLNFIMLNNGCVEIFRSLTERSDELQQVLEHDKQIIHGLHEDVTKTNEEYIQLCHELGRK